jgi:hypothetical protein
MSLRDLLLIAIQYDRRGKIEDAIRFYWMIVNTVLAKEDTDDGEKKLAEYSLKRVSYLTLKRGFQRLE